MTAAMTQAPVPSTATVFLKNKKLPGFSWKKFVDPDFLLIFVTSLLTH
jgi:hypothetical protein